MTFLLHQATGCPRFHQAPDSARNPGWSTKHTQAESIRRQQASARLGDANGWPRSDAFQGNTGLRERKQALQGAWQITEDDIRIFLFQGKAQYEEVCQ
ncbi:MAG: hypothetical protein OXF25_02210 [Cyanobacteria bacterium MAG CAR3_bin_5]|nr:hypothetical protein [Cyanobacteria bacterium MAG CAR3_bin_5]